MPARVFMDRVKNFTAKTLISPLMNEFKVALENDLYKWNGDYKYDNDENKWKPY